MDHAEGEADAGHHVDRARAQIDGVHCALYAVVRHLLRGEDQRNDEQYGRDEGDPVHGPSCQGVEGSTPGRPNGCAYSVGGCRITPMNRIVPDRFSRSAKRNGRLISYTMGTLVM